MKVSGPGGPSATSGPRAGWVGGGGATFTPLGAPSIGTAAPAAAGAGVNAVSSLDALIALQEAGTPLERRRRAVSRGGRLLDALDEINLKLLDGVLPRSAVETLAREAREQRGLTDDPALDALLAQIETRAAVELAKLETTGLAA